MKEPKTLISCKADKSAYIVFGIISGIPAVLSFYKFYKQFVINSEISAFGIDLLNISITAFLFSFFWLKKYQVIITEDELIFVSLFNGRKSIMLAEISKYKIHIGYNTNEEYAQFKPMFRLAVYSFDKQRKPIDINMKVFSLGDLKKIFDRLDGVIAENRAREKEKVVLKRKSRKKKEKDENAKQI